MKKTFAVIAAVLFVMSFAASAFAIHAEIPSETTATVAKGGTQVTLGGQIRIRGVYHHGLSNSFPLIGARLPVESDEANINDSDFSNLEQRVRLSLNAQVTPNVQGFINLESDTGSGTGDNYNWGNFSRKPNSSFQFLEAWIQYTGTGLYGFNSGLKAGHMPLVLGEGLFFDHRQYGDDALVHFMDPSKQLHIGLIYIKGSEGSSPAGDANDLDVHVALMTYKINDNHLFGLNYAFINQPGGITPANTKFDQQLHNIGLHANGKAGAFGYAGEVDFQFGSIRVGAEEPDYKGWAILLDANYKLAPAANIRGRFVYGSGQDSDDDDIKMFQAFTTGGMSKTLIYGDKMTTASGAAGYGNTTGYNLGFDYDASKELFFSIDAMYFRASEADDSKTLGTEVFGVMKYKLAKNLTLITQLNYFFTGGFYEDLVSPAAKKTDVLVARQTFVLDF